MNDRWFGRRPGHERLPVIMLAALAAVGILVSGLVAQREMQQFTTVRRLRWEQSIAGHFDVVGDYLLYRQSLARVVATLYAPPPLPTPHPLAGLGDRVLDLVTDVTTVSWLPQVTPEHANEALQALSEAGVTDPHFVGADNQPVVPETLDRPLFPLLDAVPDRQRRLLALDVGSFPDRRAAIERARDLHAVIRTGLVTLVRPPDTKGMFLYAPVYAADGRFLGVLAFGYELTRLLRDAITAASAIREFDIHVYDDGSDAELLGVAPDGTVITGSTRRRDAAGSIDRATEFAGRKLHFVYASTHDFAREARLHGVWVGLGGLMLTGGAVFLLAFTANRAARLAREVDSRRSAEQRLKGLIHELNHRVRNIMAVAQSIVRLSFSPDHDLAETQSICEGRLRALSSALSLLTNSDWSGVKLQQLASGEHLPFADRIHARGPDLALQPRSAQTFAVLLYELAANAAKYGALSTPEGQVDLHWDVDHTQNPAVFRLRWCEAGGPKVAPPVRHGFGELLVRRIGPRDVGGRAQVHYDPDGLRYELDAPATEMIIEEGAQRH